MTHTQRKAHANQLVESYKDGNRLYVARWIVEANDHALTIQLAGRLSETDRNYLCNLIGV